MTYVDLKVAGSGGNRNASPRKKSNPGKKSFASYIPAIFFTIAIIVVVANIGKIRSALAGVFNPVSIVTGAVKRSGEKLPETDGRTNILLLGVDGRITGGMVGSQLTDSIMLLSVGRLTGDAVAISVPRDVWVKSSSGGYYKINELYATYGGKKAPELQR